jgi:two-component system NarL family sensor kinase
MSNPAKLAELFLEQNPACQWVVTSHGVFERVYGDSVPLFGKAAPEIVGRTPDEALGPDRAAAWQGRFKRALKGETVLLRERQGKDAWYCTVFPIREDGEIRYAGGMAREITPWSNAEQELRHTVLGALRAQEFERAMVSKFLHDSVGQNLTALGLQLDLIRMDLETLSPETCARAIEVQKHLEEMMESVREYSYELNPCTVERAGLRPALDRMASRNRVRFSGVLRVNVDPSLKLDTKLARAMYQIAQEAVENAVQHSSCSTIEIAVKSTRTGTAVEVRDNGRGFDPADLVAGRRGLGLLSMEHYAAEAGLDLSITSTADHGTTVRAATPEVAEK